MPSVTATDAAQTAMRTIATAIRERSPGRDRPLLVALDGASGSGKSTIAALLAHEVDGTVVPSDDFFAAQIADAEWDSRSPAERVADAIDWRRLRRDALEPLLAGRSAVWHPFDFAAQRPDGTYPLSRESVQREPRPVIVVDGMYCTRPELADVIDLAVLVDVPIAIRHERLARREDAAFLAAWHERWDAAEVWYLTRVRPRAAFDLVVTNG